MKRAETVNALRDAFARARKKALDESIGTVTEAPPTSVRAHGEGAPLSKAKPFAELLTPRRKRSQREHAQKRVKVTYGSSVLPTVARAEKQESTPPAALGTAARRPAPHRPQVVQPRPLTAVSPPPVAISISKDAACAISVAGGPPVTLLSKFEAAGRLTQIQVGTADDEREVVLGLDFGTSCAKVVIGDAALGKAFAVPFCRAEGIDSFLLPSRLFQTGRVFSLEAGTHTYRDLKLSLLASPQDPILQQRVVAFLALIIRRARGWLLTEHAATYKRTAIVWKLAVGLPTAKHHQSPLSELFERLSLAAWEAAAAPGDVTEAAIQKFLNTDTTPDETRAGVEVTVVPEIAAQIYGFVASSSFDNKAPNIYLMTDVGAGTVDSSLFHVKQGKGGRCDFEFYTSVVEPNGVSNLHRHRVNWWTETLTKAGAPRGLIDELAASALVTDQQLSTPESFLEYFDGVGVSFQKAVRTPDEDFFNLRVLAQVQGKTFWRTWKDNLLPQSSLVNIPFFMCGGGVRMGYYRELQPRLSSMPGYTWLRAKCRAMAVPDGFVAEGVAEAEYDRLSVAYGLSRLEVGKVVKSLPQPSLAIPPVNIWRDHYVDKDQC